MGLVADHRVRGARIRKARREMPFEHGRRVSQETFATKLNVHWVTVSSWERGKHPPSAEHLARIAALTGKPIEFFFGDEEDEESSLRRIAADLAVSGANDSLVVELLQLAKRRAAAVAA